MAGWLVGKEATTTTKIDFLYIMNEMVIINLLKALVLIAPPAASDGGQHGLDRVHDDHEGVEAEKDQGRRPESFGLNQNSGHSGAYEIAQRKRG